MPRTYVSEIARDVGLHPQTIRNLVDRGKIQAVRDYNGWRWFPNPQKTIKQIQGLLNGETGP